MSSRVKRVCGVVGGESKLRVRTAKEGTQEEPGS